MNLEKTIENIIKSQLENITNIDKPVSFLEEIREKILDQVRLENNILITELLNSIKSRNNILNEILTNGKKIKINYTYYNQEKNFKKESSINPTLEIIFTGKKNIKIYDKLREEKFIKYDLLPVFGIAYSNNTYLSSRISKKSTLLTITIEPK